MIFKVIKYISPILILALASCTPSPEKNTIYFGGKIINPKSDNVVLYSMEKVIDTFFLDEKNKFIGELKNTNEGLYYFIHGNENQYIYLEPKDSLMLRLNTWDFDESLVFAGKGAERNNILIDCFLEEEKDERTFYKLNKLAPKEFKEKVDSLLRIKINTYNEYFAKHTLETSGFKNILNVALTYPIYAKIESYPAKYAYHSKSKEFPKLNSNFFKHREKVSYNKDSLMYYYPYSKFIRSYLYNTTYSLGHKPMTKSYSSDFTVDLLKTINSKIESSKTKNAFLKQTVLGHFYAKSSCNINSKTFDTFFELSSNEEDKLRINNLLRDNKVLHKGKPIKGFDVFNLANGKVDIKDLIKGKTSFLFFWNPEFVSKAYIASRINYLSNNYPDIEFIIIKIDGDDSDRIHNLDIKKQYFINKESKANYFLTSKMPRSILINKDGIIENGYASISSNKIYSQLQNLCLE